MSGRPQIIDANLPEAGWMGKFRGECFISVGQGGGRVGIMYIIASYENGLIPEEMRFLDDLILQSV